MNTNSRLQTELILVSKIAQKDERAFREIFDNYSQDVFRYTYSIILDRSLAEDITQETFVKLWLNADKWMPQYSLKSWLLTVARNGTFDLLRKKKIEIKNNLEIGKMSLNQPEEIKQDKVIDYEKHKTSIQNQLFLLPERQREAITLVYFMELSNAQAAEVMGMGATAFDSLLARGRRSLREMFEEGKTILQESIYGSE